MEKTQFAAHLHFLKIYAAHVDADHTKMYPIEYKDLYGLSDSSDIDLKFIFDKVLKLDLQWTLYQFPIQMFLNSQSTCFLPPL